MAEFDGDENEDSQPTENAVEMTFGSKPSSDDDSGPTEPTFLDDGDSRLPGILGNQLPKAPPPAAGPPLSGGLPAGSSAASSGGESAEALKAILEAVQEGVGHLETIVAELRNMNDIGGEGVRLGTGAD